MRLAGFDVSYGRESDTVCVVWEYTPETEDARIVDIIEERVKSQPEVIDFIDQLESQRCFDAIAIDAIGFGRGVVDHLMLRPYSGKVFPFVANEKASRDWDHGDPKDCGPGGNCSGCLLDKTYANLKSRVILEMRKMAYRGKIRVPDHPRLLDELSKYEVKQISNRWKVDDPKDSPDVADAAVVGYSLTAEFTAMFWIGR